MNVRARGLYGSIVAALVAAACGSTSRSSVGHATETEQEPTVGGEGFATGDAGGGSGGRSSCSINATSTELEKDYDGDGYPLKDDCNECSAGINKGAYDVPGNGIDEDCSGAADDEEIACDNVLAVDGADPFDGARAMGLCKKADPNGLGWGVLSAAWTMPDGKHLGNRQGVGILGRFGGNAPPFGSSMLALSSGSAREPNDPEYAGPSNSKRYTHGTPAGYPKESPACPGVTTGAAEDGAALELRIRVPSNAKSFSYQQNFFTWEYPVYICDKYNDFFVTMMTPTLAGLGDGNIAFDQDTNPISVNNSLLQVCSPGIHKGKIFGCPLGVGALEGTGFEGHAATGWLTTSAPVRPGSEITLRWAIWDSGDGMLDSTVLIDDFTFSIQAAGAPATKPTEPR